MVKAWLAILTLVAHQLAAQPESAVKFRIDGVVVDERGEKVSGAQIWVQPFREPRAGKTLARSGSDGTFHLEALPSSWTLAAIVDGRVPSEQHQVEGSASDLRSIRLVVGDAGFALRGRLRDDRLQPIANQLVLVEPQYSDNGCGPRFLDERGNTLLEQPPLFVGTDRDGCFEVRGVPKRTVRVVVEGPGLSFMSERGRVDADARIDLLVDRSVRVRGAIRDATGRAVEGAAVVVRAEHFATRATRSAPDGAFEVRDIPAGLIAVSASAGGLSDCAMFDLRAGVSAPWVAVLEDRGRSMLSGTFVRGGCAFGCDGRPLGGRKADGAGSIATDDDGCFELRVCDSQGRRPIRVVVAGGADVRVPYLCANVEPLAWGGADVELRATEADLATARVRGVFRGARPGLVLRYGNRYWTRDAAVDAATGAFATELVPAGSYRLVVLDTRTRLPCLQLGDHELDRGQTLDLAEVVSAWR